MQRHVLSGEVPWLDDADLDLETVKLADGVLTIIGSIDQGRLFRRATTPVTLEFRNVTSFAIDDPEKLGHLAIDTIRRNEAPAGFTLEGPIPGSIEILTTMDTFTVYADKNFPL
jgi:hypothetical protein